MKSKANEQKTDPGSKHLKRVRTICADLPETTEKMSHGEPTFFVNKKVYVMFANNHHNDGHIAVYLPAAIGIQAMLVKASPEKFFRPPYVALRDWFVIKLDPFSAQ